MKSVVYLCCPVQTTAGWSFITALTTFLKGDWDGVESVVTVEFNEQPGGTEMHLTHRGFPSAESRGRHEQGWTGVMEKLGDFVQG